MPKIATTPINAVIKLDMKNMILFLYQAKMSENTMMEAIKPIYPCVD